jgi:hypothetical protein
VTDLVLLEFAGEPLAFPREQFEEARARGKALMVPAAGSSGEPARLLTAEELETATGVPASWFAAQARERRIPFRKLGRYVRFDFAEVMACEALKRRAVPSGELCTGSLNRRGSASV